MNTLGQLLALVIVYFIVGFMVAIGWHSGNHVAERLFGKINARWPMTK